MHFSPTISLVVSPAVPTRIEQSVDVTPVVSPTDSLAIITRSEQIVEITHVVSPIVSLSRPGLILSSSSLGSSFVSPP